ncbi:MAG: hypothetical protein RR051_07700, partial [Clostridiales bacterium]
DLVYFVKASSGANAATTISKLYIVRGEFAKLPTAVAVTGGTLTGNAITGATTSTVLKATSAANEKVAIASETEVAAGECSHTLTEGDLAAGYVVIKMTNADNVSYSLVYTVTAP